MPAYVYKKMAELIMFQHAPIPYISFIGEPTKISEENCDWWRRKAQNRKAGTVPTKGPHDLGIWHIDTCRHVTAVQTHTRASLQAAFSLRIGSMSLCRAMMQSAERERQYCYHVGSFGLWPLGGQGEEKDQNGMSTYIAMGRLL
jgi:hypothetical protein